MKRLIEISIKKYFELRRFKVQSWIQQQHETQEIIFQELLYLGSNTQYGKKYDFKNISSYIDYQQNVPVCSYEDYAPYIQKMLDGEENILWPGVINFFSKSSGTTNDVSKYLPVSKESLQENNYKAGKDLYALIFMQYPNLKIFKDEGRALSISGSFENRDGNIKVGDVSAIIASELPSIFQERRSPSLEVALMKSWDKKIPAIISETLNQNITHLSGVPTWFVPIFNSLKEVRPYTTLRDIWPNLELFIHGAVSFKPFTEVFHSYLPFDDMKYVEVYNASEGFFAVQDSPQRKGEMLLLTDHGVFFEFIPFEKYQQGSRETILLSEVSLGVAYALVITTNAGLWRYDIGDLVEFTSNNPYRIKIVGRTKSFINLCGEELMVGNTNEAIVRVSKKLGIHIEHYTVAPHVDINHTNNRHHWVIESNEDISDITGLEDLLDVTLQGLNSDYRSKRAGDMALKKLSIDIVSRGSFMKWLEKKGKLGGQHKIPKLSEDRKIVDELLAI